MLQDCKPCYKYVVMNDDEYVISVASSKIIMKGNTKTNAASLNKECAKNIYNHIRNIMCPFSIANILDHHYCSNVISHFKILADIYCFDDINHTER